GIMVAIVAEMVGGAPGLGQELYLAQTNGQYADMMSFLILAGVLGMCINSGLRFIEKTSLGWHPSQRSNSHANKNKSHHSSSHRTRIDAGCLVDIQQRKQFLRIS